MAVILMGDDLLRASSLHELAEAGAWLMAVTDGYGDSENPAMEWLVQATAPLADAVSREYDRRRERNPLVH